MAKKKRGERGTNTATLVVLFFVVVFHLFLIISKYIITFVFERLRERDFCRYCVCFF